jgi:hypothetical protein
MLKHRTGKAFVLMLVTLAISAGASQAQDKKEQVELEIGKWYPKLDFGLVLAQSAYSDNWNGSEQGQIAWNFILNSGLTRRFTPHLNWANNLKLAFGHTHNQKFEDGGSGVRVWDQPEKTTDLIDFESLLRFTYESWVDPYLAARVLTQFLDNSDPYGRDVWVSPMTIFGSAGIAREFYGTEDEMFLSRFGAAVRQNMRQFYPDAPEISDDRRTETSHDAGVEWVTDYRIKMLQDKVLWTSKLTVYKPFEYSFREDLEATAPELSDYPNAVDINWENIFTGEIVSWLTVNLYVMFVYDKYDNSIVPELDDQGDLANPDAVESAVRKAGQFKQTLGVGITYKFL